MPKLAQLAHATAATALLGLTAAPLGCAVTAERPQTRHPALTRAHGSAGSLRPAPVRLALPLSDPSGWDAPVRARIAKAASTLAARGKPIVRGTRFRMDCSGVTRAIYAEANLPLGGTSAYREENDVSILHRFVAENGMLHTKTPLPGDLVFFDNTYDRDRNGAFDDRLTHVGVVERVLPGGTVVFVHRVGPKIVRYRMNLSAPQQRRDTSGNRMNHTLRRASAQTPALSTAELFVAYGTLSPRFIAERREEAQGVLTAAR